MTQAVAVRRDGDAFQARIFWRKAVTLLDPQSKVLRVGFESGPKGFDDVWVEFESGHGPAGESGIPLVREHTQSKWHVSIDDYGYADLIRPDFVNANTFSLLERARAAQLGLGAAHQGVRFKLLTNWSIRKDDDLRPLINQRSKTLRLDGSDGLFGSKTDASKTGRIRKLWREHLKIDDAELRAFARMLSFDTDLTSLDDHRAYLDVLFENRGLRRIPVSDSSFPYDDLMYQWLAQGRLEFDRTSFQAICKREGILAGQKKSAMVFGVKSFEHAFDRLEERCSRVLDLTSFFDERAIQHPQDWSTTLYPNLKKFLRGAAKESERLQLVLDTHATLAFAAGSILDVKSGRQVDLEQRTLGRQIWSVGDSVHSPEWAGWSIAKQVLDKDGEGVVVAVSLTHDITSAVQTFARKSLPRARQLILATLTSGASGLSVASGQHAFDLANALCAEINQGRDGTHQEIHLFIAGPNVFTFFMGQRQPGLGRVTLYEYDFEGAKGGGYSPSLSLPLVSTAPATA